MDEYQAPKRIWDVNKNLRYNEPLNDEDPKYVHTEEGRGQFSFRDLLRPLGVNDHVLRNDLIQGLDLLAQACETNPSQRYYARHSPPLLARLADHPRFKELTATEVTS